MKNYKKQKLNLKKISIFMLGCILLISAIVAGSYFTSEFETASNAVIEGKLYTINSKVPGLVTNLYVAGTQEVKKGDLIVELDRVFYEKILRDAENELRECELKLNSEKYSSEPNKRNSFSKFKFNNSGVFDNYHKMFEEGNNDDNSQEKTTNNDITCLTTPVSEHKLNSDLKPITNEKNTTETEQKTEQLEDLQTKMQRLKTEIEQAKLNLSYTRIYAPQDGTVSTVEVREGDYISSSQTILSIIPKRVWISANFTEAQSKKIEPGQAVIIKCLKYPTRKFKGMVDELELNKKIVVKNTVYIPIRILFTEDYSDFDLKPSTPVKVVVKLKKYLW